MEPTLVVAAAILDDLRKPSALLAARRLRPQRHAGRWEFPGGKVEPPESALDALRRELREELGIEIELGTEVFGPTSAGWPVADGYILRVWTASIASGVPQPLAEHDALVWLDVGHWLSVHWLDPDTPIVHALERTLGLP